MTNAASNTDPNEEVVDESVVTDPEEVTEGVTEPPAVIPPQVTGPETYTEREKILMNKARAEEKSKLYKNQEQLKTQIRELQDRIRNNSQGAPSSAPTTGTTSVSDSDVIREEIRSLREELQQTKRQSELKDYRAKRIAEAYAAGEYLVEALVDGNTEEEIDIALDVAKQEAQFLFMRRDQHAGTPPQSTNVERNGRNRPSGVPRAPARPGSGTSENDENSYSVEQIRNIIGDGTGVRSGAYAQHRPQILAALKRNRIRQ